MGGWLLVLLLFGIDDRTTTTRAEWPCLIAVGTDGPPVLPTVWAFSPTFQQQCRRLAQAQVVIVVQWADDMTPAHHAETRILRTEGRVFRAVVRLRTTGKPAVHLIHELEHVMEALDGIDQSSSSCGWQTRAGAFETARARRVEELARRELARRQYAPIPPRTAPDIREVEPSAPVTKSSKPCR